MATRSMLSVGLSATLSGAAAMLVCALSAHAQQPVASQSFTLQRSTEAPGTTLKAGAYTISMVDSLADRTVLRIESAGGGGAHVLVLAVRNTPLPGTPGPVLWDSKGQGHHALRGFVFPNGSSVEFVYPKADAVALAKANHESVVAVDTASENRPELSKLSSRDMQMVNLWMLTPTRVGPTQALEAKRFVPSGTQTEVASSATTTSRTPVGSTATSQTMAARQTSYPAQDAEPSQGGASHGAESQNSAVNASSARTVRTTTRTTARLPRPEPAEAAAPKQVATLNRPASLPQTAGHEPEIWLMTVSSLLFAAGLRLRRRDGAAAGTA